MSSSSARGSSAGACPSGFAGTKEPEPPIRTRHHELVLLTMDTMLWSLFADIENAKRRVFIETYICAGDELGCRLGDALAEAAKRGLDVRLLYDPLGSQKTEQRHFDELSERGVGARAYRPKELVAASGAPFPRDHSRIMVVDDHGYTGGAAWADPWLPKEAGGDGWHDVCLRVRGPAVEDFAEFFERRWCEGAKPEATPCDLCTGDKYSDLELVADTPKRDSLVYDRHRAAFERARERIWIENAYFFPPPAMLKDLYDAARRGIDVRVIMPAQTDLPIIQRAARSEYTDWLEHGIRIYEYEPCVMHSKYAVIDDDWCTVGTFNANPTSVGLANEVNVFVRDRGFVARVAEQFETDLGKSKEVTRQHARARPILQQAVDQMAADAFNVIDRIVGPK